MDINQGIQRALRLAAELGVPTAVHPGPTSCHVTLCWPPNSAGLVSSEFETDLPAGEAVKIFKRALGLEKEGEG